MLLDNEQTRAQNEIIRLPYLLCEYMKVIWVTNASRTAMYVCKKCCGNTIIGLIWSIDSITVAKQHDLRPVILTPILSKCLERIMLSKVMNYVCPHLDPLQFAYLAKRTTEDARNTLLHHTTHHLDKKTHTYVRSLFIDYGLEFNTMQHHLLINKLNRYDVHPSLQIWILKLYFSPTEPNT